MSSQCLGFQPTTWSGYPAYSESPRAFRWARVQPVRTTKMVMHPARVISVAGSSFGLSTVGGSPAFCCGLFSRLLSGYGAPSCLAQFSSCQLNFPRRSSPASCCGFYLSLVVVLAIRSALSSSHSRNGTPQHCSPPSGAPQRLLWSAFVFSSAGKAYRSFCGGAMLLPARYSSFFFLVLQ